MIQRFDTANVKHEIRHGKDKRLSIERYEYGVGYSFVSSTSIEQQRSVQTSLYKLVQPRVAHATLDRIDVVNANYTHKIYQEKSQLSLYPFSDRKKDQ